MSLFDVEALSLWQPWAQLMAYEFKGNETRHWYTRHRGYLAIHAAQRRRLREEREVIASIQDDCRAAGRPIDLFKVIGQPESWPRGAVVALVSMKDCMRTEAIANPLEYACGDYSEGRFAWITDRPRRLTTPVPWRGAQSMFRVPRDAIRPYLPADAAAAVGVA